MDSAPGGLYELIQRLRLYKPPPPPDDEDDMDEKGKVFSSMGISEAQASLPKPFQPKRAAVLICLFVGERGELRVILTKRSRNLSTHSGEVSLPGGKMEEGDKDDADTATREAKEEIGLDPSIVTVVALLEPFLSRVTRFQGSLHTALASLPPFYYSAAPTVGCCIRTHPQ
ncbi:hypothetical protein ZIOFF_043372 [Zingiber officinale]|uniref:Nudix hydrolase domain-containing protein n=1 Tax=Zingiber officinale TaxID=94328 RepID=A0A8J5FWF8_ZINOF|nr:hypothetical protein ZIOFF_043372 [Zingiber officinale]